MSKITDLSFTSNGADAEQRFAKMVDGYLGGQKSVHKTLEDGTQISIRKQNLDDRGAARFINIYDNAVGWEFVLYPIANIDPDTKLAGLKCSRRMVNLPEFTGSLDSRDLDTLENFLAENM